MVGNKGNILVTFLITLLLVAVFVVGYFYFQTQSLKLTLSGVQPVIVKQTVPQTSTQVKFIALNSICDNGPVKGFSITLNKAYLLNSFADFPDYKLKEIHSQNASASGLLVLESGVRNLSVSGNTEGIYGSYIFRLRRGSVDSGPIIYGATMVAPQENKTIYAYFPVNKGENSFKVMYCNYADHPALVSLDFSSTDSKILTGIYAIDKGFTLSR